MKKKSKRFRVEESRDALENERLLRRRANTSRDYANLQRMGTVVRVGGVLLALVLLVYGVYTVVNGVIPYIENQTVSSVVSEEASSETESKVELPPVYDEMGLPVYENDVSLRVINPFQPAEADDVPVLAEFQDAMVDERILPALEAMCAAAEKAGAQLYIVGGYIAYHDQETAFNNRVSKLVGEGMTTVMATNHAEKQLGRAGMSDMQTGLCIRLAGNANTFTTTEAYEWLNNHALSYGFVFRYPKGVEDITGHETDLMILRYVGVENARQMRRLNMCLEEYVEHISKQG